MDLGAHIGLASMWLVLEYAFEYVLAVEPDRQNARLATANLRELTTPHALLHAAVGTRRGRGRFLAGRSSNMGQLVEGGGPDASGIQVHTLQEVFDQLPDGQPVSLLKMDIEGAEAGILEGDIDCLEAVATIVAELHPPLVEYGGDEKLTERGIAVIKRLTAHGFIHVAPPRRGRDLDIFVRHGLG